MNLPMKLRLGDVMRITFLELQKIFRSPVIIILIIVFVGFNVFTILSNSYWKKDELKVLNKIVDTYGLTFNDEILKKMEEDIYHGVSSIDGQAESIDTFFNELTYEKYESYAVSDQKAIDELSLLYMYYNQASLLDERYAEINIQEIGKGMIQSFELRGVTEKFVSNEYEKLAERFDEMVEQEEHKTWFFAGNPYRMHSQLFWELMSMIAIEGTILVVLISAYLACYERDHRTSLVTYATKTGRRLIYIKWQATLLGTFLIGGLLLLPTLAIYFTVFDYRGVWQSRISSGLNWENLLPYVTWWDVSFIEYLGLAIFIIFAAWLIISTLTFALSIFIQNSYISTVFVYLLLVAMFVIPSLFTFSSLLFLLGHFNLTLLILNPHMYFNGLAGLTGVEYHEFITLLLWTVIAGLLLMISCKSFLRKDFV